MPWDDNDEWYDVGDDADYAEPATKPLKKRSKKQLRRLVKDKAKALEAAEEELRKERAFSSDLLSYLEASARHKEMLKRIYDEVFDRWLIVDFTLESYQQQVVDVSSLQSVFSENVVGAPVTAKLLITLHPNPTRSQKKG